MTIKGFWKIKNQNSNNNHQSFFAYTTFILKIEVVRKFKFNHYFNNCFFHLFKNVCLIALNDSRSFYNKK